MIAAFDMGIKNFAFAVKDKGNFILLKNTCLDEDIVTKSDLNHHKKEELVEMMCTLNINRKVEEKLKKKIWLILSSQIKKRKQR
jgi:hypothetical protein